jgi:hypothetical protein
MSDEFGKDLEGRGHSLYKIRGIFFISEPNVRNVNKKS